MKFNNKFRKEILKKLDSAKKNTKVYIFKSDNEADLFLLKNRNGRAWFAIHDTFSNWLKLLH